MDLDYESILRMLGSGSVPPWFPILAEGFFIPVTKAVLPKLVQAAADAILGLLQPLRENPTVQEVDARFERDREAGKDGNKSEARTLEVDVEELEKLRLLGIVLFREKEREEKEQRRLEEMQEMEAVLNRKMETEEEERRTGEERRKVKRGRVKRVGVEEGESSKRIEAERQEMKILRRKEELKILEDGKKVEEGTKTEDDERRIKNKPGAPEDDLSKKSREEIVDEEAGNQRATPEKAVSLAEQRRETDKHIRQVQRQMELTESRVQQGLETRAKEIKSTANHPPAGIQPLVWPSEAQSIAAREQIKYDPDHLNFGVAGIAGCGKSSLINVFLGLRNKDIGAAPTGVKETTLKIARYPDPSNLPLRKLRVWYDIPGAGTQDIPAWQYFNQLGLFLLDVIIVVIGDRVTQIDIDILYHCRLFKIPSVIVRSKADQHIRNMMQGDDWETSDEGGEEMRELCRAEYVAITRRNIAGELKKAGLPRQKVYIVSCVLAFREFCSVSTRSLKTPKEGIKKARNFIDEEELMRDLMILAAVKRCNHIIPSAERAEHQPTVLTPQTRPEAPSPVLTEESCATRQSAATPNSQSPMEEIRKARNFVDRGDPMLNLIPNAVARAVSPVLMEKSCPIRQTVTTANSSSFLTDLFRCIDQDIPDIQGPPSSLFYFCPPILTNTPASPDHLPAQPRPTCTHRSRRPRPLQLYL